MRPVHTHVTATKTAPSPGQTADRLSLTDAQKVKRAKDWLFEFRDRYDDPQLFAHLRGSKPGTTELADETTKPILAKMLVHEAVPLAERVEAAEQVATLLRRGGKRSAPDASGVMHEITVATLLAGRLQAIETPRPQDRMPNTAEAFDQFDERTSRRMGPASRKRSAETDAFTRGSSAKADSSAKRPSTEAKVSTKLLDRAAYRQRT